MKLIQRAIAGGAVLLVVGAAAARAGQASGAPPPPQAAQPEGQRPEAAAAAPADTYTYNPEGRRDPFQSLVNRGADMKAASIRPPGLTGVLVSEVNIKGIVQDRGAFVAMLQAPDNKTYLVRPNDRLLDGTVKAVTADAVLFLQDVNDPLSLVKQREVRKPLRPIEEGKE